jgi:hypothetical protein
MAYRVENKLHLSNDHLMLRMVNRGSLHYAPPDFLWNLVALVHFMRLSLTERRTHVHVHCCVAGNPGTLRSG